MPTRQRHGSWYWFARGNPQAITHTPQITNNATVNCRPTLADIMRASEVTSCN
jgi:hypothetical protein